jgi:hypothetical protein
MKYVTVCWVDSNVAFCVIFVLFFAALIVMEKGIVMLFLSQSKGGGEVHIHTHDAYLSSLSLLFPLPLLFLVRSHLSLLFPFLSHLSALTIQFMTMNAGELLANSLSAGKVLCLLVRPAAESRPSASPSPSHSPSEFPTIPIPILILPSSTLRSGYA